MNPYSQSINVPGIMDSKIVLKNLPLNLDTVQDTGLRTTIEALYNLIEELARDYFLTKVGDL